MSRRRAPLDDEVKRLSRSLEVENEFVKVLIEILLAIFLHPVAFVLAILNIAGREDLNTVQKVLWAVICLFWGIGPILYVLLGRGDLW